MLEPGRAADFIVLDGSPLADIRVLQDKSRLRGVYIAGKEIRIPDRPYDPRQVTDFALSNWTDLYTQERVAELRGPAPAGGRRVAAGWRRTMADIVNPKLQRLYEYWVAKRGDRGLPARADIDPLDMTFVVGNVILVDVSTGTPPRFRIRLHGTTLAQRVGYELTGKMLDELPVNRIPRSWSQRSFTLQSGDHSGEPLHVATRPDLIDGRFASVTRPSIMPLSDDGERVRPAAGRL